MLKMLRVRCCNIDKIHLLILQKLLIGAISLPYSVSFCKTGCLVQISGRCRIHAKALGFPYCIRHRRGNGTAPENSYIQSAHFKPPLLCRKPVSLHSLHLYLLAL